MCLITACYQCHMTHLLLQVIFKMHLASWPHADFGKGLTLPIFIICLDLIWRCLFQTRETMDCRSTIQMHTGSLDTTNTQSAVHTTAGLGNDYDKYSALLCLAYSHYLHAMLSHSSHDWVHGCARNSVLQNKPINHLAVTMWSLFSL